MAARAETKSRRDHAVKESLERVSAEARYLFSFLNAYCYGPARARTARQLAADTGLHTRQINELVRELRLADIPVCSSCSDADGMGYFVPRSRDEAADTAAQLEMRFKKIAVVHHAFQRGLERWFGPPSLFDDQGG